MLSARLQAGAIDIRHQHPRSSSGFCRLQREQTDHPGANHQRRFAALHLRNPHRVQRHRDRFEHRRLLELERFRQLIGDALRHHDILRKGAGAAKVSAGNPDHLPVIAQVNLALETKLALPAVHGGIERHPIAGLEFAHPGAYRGYNPCRFMPHNNRWNTPAGGAIVPVHITAADATCGHTHQDLFRSGHRCRQIGDVELVVLRKKQSFHIGRVHGW